VKLDELKNRGAGQPYLDIITPIPAFAIYTLLHSYIWILLVLEGEIGCFNG